MKEDSNSNEKIIDKNENNLRNILQNDKYDKDNNNQVPMLNINNKDYKKWFNQIVNSEDNLFTSKNMITEISFKNNKIKYLKELLK